MPHYYARIEAINLSYSVYDTNDISTIRGGSFMVLNAFRNLEAAENGITVLSSNASEFLCKYSARDEKEANSIFQTLVNKIPAEVKSIASFVGGFCEVHDTDGFQKTTERLKAAGSNTKCCPFLCQMLTKRLNKPAVWMACGPGCTKLAKMKSSPQRFFYGEREGASSSIKFTRKF